MVDMSVTENMPGRKEGEVPMRPHTEENVTYANRCPVGMRNERQSIFPCSPPRIHLHTDGHTEGTNL